MTIKFPMSANANTKLMIITSILSRVLSISESNDGLAWFAVKFRLVLIVSILFETVVVVAISY